MPIIDTDLSRQIEWVAVRGFNNSFTLTFTNSGAFDVSDYTFVVNIRRIGRTSNVLQLTQGSGITNGGVSGIVTIQLSASNSLLINSGSYFYQIEYVVDGLSYRLLHGTLNLISQYNGENLDNSITLEINTAGTDVNLSIELAGGSITIADLGETLQTAADDTPLNPDTFFFWDFVDSILKKVSWANINVILNTLYDAIGSAAAAQSAAASDATSKANAAQAAAQVYADGLVVGLWDDRGNFDASGSAYPSSGGSGTAGAIKKGDVWTISVAGTLPTAQVVEIGDVVRALIDTPGNTQANWAIQQNNIGYTAENSSNKKTTMTGNETSNVFYLTAKTIYDWAVGLFQAILVSGTNIKTINGSSILGSGDLVVSGGGSGVNAITSNRTYYVATTGSNSNSGLSSGAAFLTIQKAFDVLSLLVISADVTINVAAGTYAEMVEAPPLIYGGDYTVTVVGASTQNDTGTSESGVTYSSSAGNVVTAKLTDNGKAWSANEHRTSTSVRFLHILSGAAHANDGNLNWYVIRANDATTLEIVGDWNSGSPSTNTVYEIVTLTTILNGAAFSANIVYRGDRVRFLNVKLIDAINFSIAAFKGQQNLIVASFVDGLGSTNVGVINGGFRIINCYLQGTTNNISYFESFSLGDYDEDFITSSANTNSVTGVKGSWIDGGTNAGLQISGSHTRVTGCYFTSSGVYAIENIRSSTISIYGNDGTGLNITSSDQSYIKIHTGNKFNVVSILGSTIEKASAGGWFSAIIASLTLDKNSQLVGATFTPTATTDLTVTHSARIYHNTNQSIANTGSPQVAFNSSRYDVGGLQNTNTLVAPVAGLYTIGFNGNFAANATGTRRIARIRLNSNNSIHLGIAIVGPTANQAVVNIVTEYVLAAGDIIDVTVSHDATGSINLENNNNWSPELWMSRKD